MAASAGNSRRSLEQLREARRRVEQDVSENEHRQSANQIREESHDQRAITVRSVTTSRNLERRRGRTDVELRRDREELRRQWESEHPDVEAQP